MWQAYWCIQQASRAAKASALKEQSPLKRAAAPPQAMLTILTELPGSGRYVKEASGVC